MKKSVSFLFIAFWCLVSYGQGTVELRGTVSAGSAVAGVEGTYGQTFNEQNARISEGLQQGYFTETRDTLLLLSNEMGTYTPGNNEVDTLSAEGYDERRHRQVYQMTCTGDYEETMTTSGVPTKTVLLAEPTVLPAGSLSPAGPVVLVLDRSNPYDYPVGDTTVATWTASVAGQSRQCQPKVIIHYYSCITSVSDYEANTYPVVRLGYYCWTGKNMRATRYGDGSTVPNVMTYPASYAAGVSDMAGTFGHLYTWDAATNYNIVGTRMQGVCPSGWHVPNAEETEYLLALFDAPELMSDDPQIRWIPENGTDDYDFTFLPAGYYNASSDRYEGLYVSSYFWSTETDGSTIAHACEFGSACGTIEIVPSSRSNGYSVRCVLNY